MNIKKFADFDTVNENSEFDFQHLNPDGGSAVGLYDNPSLSRDSYDKHQSLLSRSLMVLTTLGQNSAPSIAGLKGKLTLEEQNITNLTILRIVQRNTIVYDAYITFVIQNVEYWGVVEDMTTKNAVFTSEVFNDPKLVQSKEWIVRTKGFIINTLSKWLLPEEGTYRLLESSINITNNTTGNLTTLEAGTHIEVLRSGDNKILISVNDQRYTLTNRNFIYFNWWFEIVH